MLPVSRLSPPESSRSPPESKPTRSATEAIRVAVDEQIGLLRTESREGRRDLDRKLERLRDRVDANAATHDANIKEVGAQVVAFNERVSRVEGYIEATSDGEWPVASGQ